MTILPIVAISGVVLLTAYFTYGRLMCWVAFDRGIRLAAAHQVDNHLLPALEYLRTAFRAKAQELDTVVKSGRTHLMDATPVTLGQEFGGYATQVDIAADVIRDTSSRSSTSLACARALALSIWRAFWLACCWAVLACSSSA